MADLISLAHKRGTLASFITLAGASNLTTGQLYYLTDTAQIAIATSASAYVLYSASKTIASNTTLTVNGTDNVSLLYFVSLNSAIDYLTNYTILGGAVVTVQIANGDYTCANTIEINHPQSEKIFITGNVIAGVQFSQVVSTALVTGYRETVIKTNSSIFNNAVAGGMAVGNIVEMHNATEPERMCGTGEIILIDAPNYSIKVRQYTNATAPTVGTSKYVSITIFLAKLQINQNTLFNVTNTLNINDVALFGVIVTNIQNTTSVAIKCNNGACFNVTSTAGIAFINFKRAIHAICAGVNVTYIHASNCSATSDGYVLYMEAGTRASITFLNACWNNNNIYALNGTTCAVAGGYYASITTSATASKLSQVLYLGTHAGTVTLSPVANTLGNQNSIIVR